MKKLFFLVCSIVFTSSLLLAQAPNPVSWKYKAVKVNDAEYDIIFTADVDNGWYIYSQFLEEGGPIPTSFEFNSSEIELVGKTKEEGNKKESFDELFEMTVIKFLDKATFTQRVKLNKKVSSIQGYLTFMTCNGENCLPPTDVDFEVALE